MDKLKLRLKCSNCGYEFDFESDYYIKLKKKIKELEQERKRIFKKVEEFIKAYGFDIDKEEWEELKLHK